MENKTDLGELRKLAIEKLREFIETPVESLHPDWVGVYHAKNSVLLEIIKQAENEK